MSAARDDVGGGGSSGAQVGQPAPKQRQQGLEHLKAALADVSAEPGATVHYVPPGASPPPQIDPENVGTKAADLEGRDFIVAPSADGRRVDVVERIDLPGPEAICTDLTTGFGPMPTGGPVILPPVAGGATGEGAGGGGGGRV